MNNDIWLYIVQKSLDCKYGSLEFGKNDSPFVFSATLRTFCCSWWTEARFQFSGDQERNIPMLRIYHSGDNQAWGLYRLRRERLMMVRLWPLLRPLPIFKLKKFCFFLKQKAKCPFLILKFWWESVWGKGEFLLVCLHFKKGSLSLSESKFLNSSIREFFTGEAVVWTTGCRSTWRQKVVLKMNGVGLLMNT